MSTQAGTPYLLGRVVSRAGLGVWRHRGGVLLAVVATAAVGGYAAMTWTGQMPLSPGSAAGVGASAAGSDCADAAIAALADKSTTSAQRAYACMDGAFQQRVSETQFVQQMQTQRVPNANKVERVGDYHAAGGGTMVYYAVDSAQGQSVGYIVYVAPSGKVLRIE